MHPSRIVCLSAEAAETLALLGESDRIVGGPGAFVSARRVLHPWVHPVPAVDGISALEPDLVLGSGHQHADILGPLAQRGIAVHLFAQSSVSSILEMIRVIGALVGRDQGAAAHAASLEWRIEAIRAHSQNERRPRIYFEEASEPSISASGWIDELIEVAGGVNCFPELAARSRRDERVVQDPDKVAQREPDIIVALANAQSFDRARVTRANWKHVPAVMNGEIHSIDPALIQQPGPVALTQGLDALHLIVESWRERRTRVFHTAFKPVAMTAVDGPTERVA
jgi:iron complex transport system substrate-binding protein